MENKFENIKLFLFDMDGTIYLGNRLFSFTKELLKTIKNTGRRYMFITNNSSKSVEMYVKKLALMGINAAYDDFFTSSQATAWYLKKYHKNKTLYVCGTKSLIEELEQNGFKTTTDINKTECIVIGYDTELTYKKLEDVCYLLITKDLPFIATNPDSVCPYEFGNLPDCGSICDMIFNATGKRPTVIGKPNAYMINLAMEKCGVSKNKTAVIGDRINTDIKSAINAGVLSVLVSTGETTKEILSASKDKPDVVLNNAGEILNYIK